MNFEQSWGPNIQFINPKEVSPIKPRDAILTVSYVYEEKRAKVSLKIYTKNVILESSLDQFVSIPRPGHTTGSSIVRDGEW